MQGNLRLFPWCSASCHSCWRCLSGGQRAARAEAPARNAGRGIFVLGRRAAVCAVPPTARSLFPNLWRTARTVRTCTGITAKPWLPLPGSLVIGIWVLSMLGSRPAYAPAVTSPDGSRTAQIAKIATDIPELRVQPNQRCQDEMPGQALHDPEMPDRHCMIPEMPGQALHDPRCQDRHCMIRAFALGRADTCPYFPGGGQRRWQERCQEGDCMILRDRAWSGGHVLLLPGRLSLVKVGILSPVCPGASPRGPATRPKSAAGALVEFNTGRSANNADAL